MKRLIFDIQRFCINDGPGIRTTIFLKGCPLDCVWCHNPESKQFDSELMYIQDKCINCNNCFNICENHKIINSKHEIRRDLCTKCGRCVEKCSGALNICGSIYPLNDVIEEVLKDINYYKESNGGVTISGGEPLVIIEETIKLIKIFKEYNIHTCIETSGYTNFDNILKVCEYVDLFLYDIKETNNELHKKYTKVSNDLIINNLYKLNNLGKKIILRCPIIKGYNDRLDHFIEIGKLSQNLDNIIEIQILPYHNMGKSKAINIGATYDVNSVVPNQSEVDNWINIISKYTNKTVKKIY